VHGWHGCDLHCGRNVSRYDCLRMHCFAHGIDARCWVGESTMSVHQDRVEIVMTPVRAAVLKLNHIKACVREAALAVHAHEAALRDLKPPCEQPVGSPGDV